MFVCGESWGWVRGGRGAQLVHGADASAAVTPCARTGLLQIMLPIYLRRAAQQSLTHLVAQKEMRGAFSFWGWAFGLFGLAGF